MESNEKDKKIEGIDKLDSSFDDNMYGDFIKKKESKEENNSNNNSNITTESTNNSAVNSNNGGIINQTYAYKEKEYNSDFLETHTVTTSSSKVSRVFLVFFYLIVLVVGVIAFYLLRSDKYAFYLKKDEVLMSNGSSYQVEIIPKNSQYFDYLNYDYKISDESVATVDEYGTVTAVGIGTTNLKISLKSGLGSKTMKINSQNINVESVELRADIGGKLELKNNIDIYVDETVTLHAAANNDENLNISVQYESSNPNVAIVDEFGNVTGRMVGKTEITGKKDGVVGTVIVNVKRAPNSSNEQNTTPVPVNPTATPGENNPAPTNTPKPGSPTNVPVPTSEPTAVPKPTATPKPGERVHVKSVDIGITQTTKYVGDTLQLYAKLNPIDAVGYPEIWKTSNNDVAMVTNRGLVVAKKAGTAIISVEVDGKISKGTLIIKNRPGTIPTPTPIPATSVPNTPVPVNPTATPIETPEATVAPTTAPQVPQGQQFSASEIQLSSTTLTVSKGGTGTFNIRVNKAAGKVIVSSSNVNVAKVSVDSDLLSEDSATCKKSGNSIICFFDGISRADTITYTVTGSGSGTASINVSLDDLGKYEGGTVSGSGKVGVLVQ